MKWSTNIVLYILQLLQVLSEHHVTSIPITLAETNYNILCKVWEQKQQSWYNDNAYSQQQDFSLLQNVQTGSGVHIASYSMCTIILFQG
jgi:hypothetical protein